MTTKWRQETYDCSTQEEREAERNLRVHSESLVPRPAPRTDLRSTKRVGAESLPAAGYTQWKMRFVGWAVMLAALAGVMIFFFLNVASFGVLGSAVMVAAIMAALGLGHYLLWGRRFARVVVGEGQRFQHQVRRSDLSDTELSGELPFGLNDRERMELKQNLEFSLAAAKEALEGTGDGATIRR